MTGLLSDLRVAAHLAGSLRHLLVGVGPADPATYAVLVPLVLLVGALASYLPARRAGRIDPMAVLRAG